MTTTDIGILLIILCVLLWAIMAALHRHTVQLKALKAQMEALLDATRSTPSRGNEESTPSHNEHDEPRVARASGEKRA